MFTALLEKIDLALVSTVFFILIISSNPNMITNEQLPRQGKEEDGGKVQLQQEDYSKKKVIQHLLIPDARPDIHLCTYAFWSLSLVTSASH